MAVKFAAGTEVKQKMPAPIAGVVKRFVFDETTADISYIIEDADGNEWTFVEANLEAA
jgi:hypothetical protein